MKSKDLLKYFYLVCGWFFLALGVIGIFLPLLPTTPFLLLTAFFFNRGSEKFHNWLLNHKWFGPPILDWQKRRAIQTKYKMLATLMMLASSLYLLAKPSIPLIGKASYVVFLSGMLLFLWTRNSR